MFSLNIFDLFPKEDYAKIGENVNRMKCNEKEKDSYRKRLEKKSYRILPVNYTTKNWD